MTEYELAATFVREFAEASAIAARGGPPRDLEAFLSFCRGHGLRPTCERFSLVRDLERVLVEELMRRDLPPSRPAHGGCSLTAQALVDGLERYGWRIEFLARDARHKRVAPPRSNR